MTPWAEVPALRLGRLSEVLTSKRRETTRPRLYPLVQGPSPHGRPVDSWSDRQDGGTSRTSVGTSWSSSLLDTPYTTEVGSTTPSPLSPVPPITNETTYKDPMVMLKGIPDEGVFPSPVYPSKRMDKFLMHGKRIYESK